MPALPPKADMCGATSDVRFGPQADITALVKKWMWRRAVYNARWQVVSHPHYLNRRTVKRVTHDAPNALARCVHVWCSAVVAVQSCSRNSFQIKFRSAPDKEGQRLSGSFVGLKPWTRAQSAESWLLYFARKRWRWRTPS
jgi:hypothetical protein